MRTIRFAVLIALFFSLFLAVAAIAQPQTSCIRCHDSDLFSAEDRAKVKAFHADVHAQAGLSCHDCHGGNPDPKIEDMVTAMDPQYKPAPFIGRPKRTDIPAFCGKCHSSAAFMKRFNPAARVDQVTEYASSMHGKLLAKGDEQVATCIDCHSVHGIRSKADPESPVYPTHVAETCSHCHSDAKRMSSYGIPTDQFAKWSISVHARNLLVKGDLSSPTCNDCHGNHGATPPGIESVSFVCGQCHARESELFRASTKHQGWTAHNELLAGGLKCGDCHDDGRAKVDIKQFSECVTCHGNHGVIRPSIALIGILPDTPCAFCHEGTGPLANVVAEPKAKSTHYRQLRGQLLATADRMKLQGDRKFDWLVDQAQNLATHKLPAREKEQKTELRPEFARLFEKFRIGKTHEGPITVRKCGDCHQTDEAGANTAKAFLDSTRSLTSAIARSERILLSAHRGGVEVGKARAELDSAVDNQIELESLVHTFGTGDAVKTKTTEGLQHARAALVAAQESLDELSFRRRGLFIALGLVLLALIALAMKIRTL